jgi:hypothetical protein
LYSHVLQKMISTTMKSAGKLQCVKPRWNAAIYWVDIDIP